MPISCRRQNTTCAKASDRYWKSCTCAMWVEPTVDANRLRHSLKSKSWEEGVTQARLTEPGENAAPPATKETPITIVQAADEYLADPRARQLRASTFCKLKIIFRKQLLNWCKAERCKILVNLRALQAFRAT